MNPVKKNWSCIQEPTKPFYIFVSRRETYRYKFSKRKINKSTRKRSNKIYDKNVQSTLQLTERVKRDVFTFEHKSTSFIRKIQKNTKYQSWLKKAERENTKRIKPHCESIIRNHKRNRNKSNTEWGIMVTITPKGTYIIDWTLFLV